jgi:glyoxylase-like metal-dependent hydrolase (beta-lactamase superfamily II)
MNTSGNIHRVEGRVMDVNAYLIEAHSGLVLVDGMLTLSDARAVRDRIDAIGKPVLAAVVTHAHPDHYAGLAEILRGRDVPIASTAAVRLAIERDDALKDSIVGPMMGAEWPALRTFPTQDIAADGSVQFGGITLQVTDVGAAESPADSVYRFGERSFFVGDLVYARKHAYLADGFATAWLACLERLERELPKDAVLYVGHGAPAGRELFAAQRRYIEAFVASVERHESEGPAERRRAVIEDMKRALPTEDLSFLMELSIEPFLKTRAS